MLLKSYRGVTTPSIGSLDDPCDHFVQVDGDRMNVIQNLGVSLLANFCDNPFVNS